MNETERLIERAFGREEDRKRHDVMLRNRLDMIYKGGGTTRFHTHDCIKPQSVGLHSFGVAWMVWLLADGNPTVEEIMAALGHDLAEHITGDVPAPSKRALGVRNAFGGMEAQILHATDMDFEYGLSALQSVRLKLADALDGMMYCVQERSRGNVNLRDAYLTFSGYVKALLGERVLQGNRRGRDIYNNLAERWMQLEIRA